VKTDVSTNRMLVTSDTHIGSLFCNARPAFTRLLDYAADRGYTICLNGDGIDVLHTTLLKMTMEAAALLREFRRIADKTTIYYTIGNHDIILEHYLGDWGRLQLVPFLNVSSGGKRIRVEHGHLYDPFLMKYPDLQPALTRFIGWCCRVYPPWYHWEEQIKLMRYKHLPNLFRKSKPAEHGLMFREDENPSFIEAAEELSQRGFDAVIFGHTHHPGVMPLNANRALYYNTGGWARDPHYLTIDDGEITLKRWRG
jgi:UDP-2,3-diacylglucosamine pyrophosphatase LpxH